MAGVVIATAWAGAAPAKPDLPLYKDPKAPLEARVEDLLKRMTLEEKVAQMLSIWDAKTEVFDAKRELDPNKMAQKYPNGVGRT
jgi:beta-glucosidase